MTATPIQPTHVLDLRTIPPRERHPLIFGRFDGLAVGHFPIGATEMHGLGTPEEVERFQARLDAAPHASC